MRRARLLSLAGLPAALVLSPLGATAPHAAADDGARAGLSPVRATFKLSADQTVASGRVVSKDASCKKKVSVHLFARLGDDVEYAGEYLTDNQGRWSSDDETAMPRLQAAVVLFAVVPGEKGCKVAQSPSEKLDTTRAGRASRSITIDFHQNALEGRVTSTKAACEKQAPIAFFYREAASQPWSFGDTDRTNNNGRYRYSFLMKARSTGWRAAKAKAPVIAVALADKQCAVAQSPETGLPAM